MAPMREALIDVPEKKPQSKVVLPPRKMRKTVSTAAILKKATKRHPQDSAPSAVMPAGIVKPNKLVNPGSSKLKNREGLSIRSTHPLAIAFESTTARCATEAARVSKLSVQTAHGTLLARLNGLNLNGKPLEATNSLATKLAEAVNAAQIVDTPLAAERLRIRSNINGVPNVQEVTLGALMDTFATKVENKKQQLEALFKEYVLVQQEIFSLGAGVLGSDAIRSVPDFADRFSGTPTIKASSALEMQCAHDYAKLKDDIGQVGDEMMKVIEQEEREEKARNKQKKKEWDAFLRTQT
ncbi:hypothetical protein LTR66_006291 [Elasticomyces elasticus]|nr:hypothetical protein LTR66_006291 [Elasticomyces elasticus]KAK5005495.1 hypothetical protein LTR28_007646 [Elasticomyces elasticus]